MLYLMSPVIILTIPSHCEHFTLREYRETHDHMDGCTCKKHDDFW